jgi:signal transduction histidine kinase
MSSKIPHHEDRTIKKVLLVDDEPLVLKALVRVLDQEGYDTYSFRDVDEAIARLSEVKPDCVISDYYMPHLDGLEFLREVRNLCPDVPKVLLTGGYIDQRVKDAMQDEVVHILLQKPWQIESIRKVMQHAQNGDRNTFVSEYEKLPTQEEVARASRESSYIVKVHRTVARLLIIDEDPTYLESLDVDLTGLGYQVHTLNTIGQMEEKRRKSALVGSFDLVIATVSGSSLPDSLEIGSWGVPVIMITEDGDHEPIVKAIRQGVFCCLQKPIKSDRLESSIHRCMVLKALKSKNDRALATQAIFTVQHAISNRASSSELLSLLLQEMIRYTNADAASVMLQEPEANAIRIAASYGLGRIDKNERRVVFGERVSGWVMQHNEPKILVGEADLKSSLAPVERRRKARVGMCLPMRGRDRVLGVLNLTRFESDEVFSHDALDLGMVLGEEIARFLEQTELAEEKLDLERNLMRRDKMVAIGELAAGIAHEINNPLGYVSSNIYSLKEYLGEIFESLKKLVESSDPKSRQKVVEDLMNMDLAFILEDVPICIQETADGLDRVLKIVADLKNFARDDTEQKEESDLVQIIEGAVGILWNQIKYKAKLVREYSKLPWIACFPSQLGQVFMNLVYNAVQAIEKNGIITLRANQVDDSIVVEIADNGKGMRPDVAARIFEPFYTTKARGVGTGLGLSIARKIIVRHSGTISVESVEGQGTTFRITLPCGLVNALSHNQITS